MVAKNLDIKDLESAKRKKCVRKSYLQQYILKDDQINLGSAGISGG